MPERDFKGIWIPANVWLDDRLNALEKVILAEINSLDCEKGCWASNDYISEFCQCSSSKVSKAISKLVELGYVRVESFNGRCRVLRSSLAKNARQTSRFCQADEQILAVSNIKNKINNKINNNDGRKCHTHAFVPPTLQEVEEYAKSRNSTVDPKRFWDYFDAGEWKDAKGQPVRSWKQKFITWENKNAETKKEKEPERRYEPSEWTL